jgi:hypothetical protein
MCDHNRELFSPKEQMVMDTYEWRCVICMFACATSLHEEPPRSLNPNWKNEPWTQFPLCNAHHEAVQSMSRGDAEDMILLHVDIIAPGAIERIKTLHADEL